MLYHFIKTFLTALIIRWVLFLCQILLFVVEKSEDIVKSILPITLDLKIKEIGRTGNVTCAAIASQHGMIKSKEEFLKGYEAELVE